MRRRHALSLALVTVVGCTRDGPEHGGAAPASPAPSAAETDTANSPAPDVTMKLSVTEEHGAGGDTLRLAISIENRAATPKTIGYFKPLGFQLVASDPKSGREIPVVIPAYDIPVQHVVVTLAPGESRDLGSAVTLWFDETGTPRPTMFEWTVRSPKVPLKLRVKLEVTEGDGPAIALFATAVSR